MQSADDWWKVRRPEIVEYFDAEVYGRVPANVPKVTWKEVQAGELNLGFPPMRRAPTGPNPNQAKSKGQAAEAKSVPAQRPNSGPTIPGAITKYYRGEVDNSAFPSISVNLVLMLVIPESARGPVPVMLDFGGGGGMQQYLAQGWGWALISPMSIQADHGAGLTKGIIGLVNKGQYRKPDDWGALRAWAWGASRAVDFFESQPTLVDAKRVGISGLSRYGKAAAVAMAYDQRFSIGLIGSSGAGGAKLLRRNWGEQVENLVSSGEYHWFAGNFLKYGGPLAPCDLPVDAHMLLALCAPRPTFISYGANTGPGAEGYWVDQKGSFMAAVAAGPAWTLLGKKDLGLKEFPAVETAVMDGELAWRMHRGGHTTGPNIDTFVTFAARYWNATGKSAASATPAATTDPANASTAGKSSTTAGETNKPVQPSKVMAIERRDPNSMTAHQKLLQKAKQGRIDLYFLGDSITRRWGATDYPDFLAHWKEQFHGWNAGNFGWGGDSVQNILWRVQHGELAGVNPKVIVLMAGTNNLSGIRQPGVDENKVSEVTNGIKAIIASCREQASKATIIVMSITPRSDNPNCQATISAINQQLAKLADGNTLRYVNLHDKLADATGKLRPDVSPDRLHLNRNGYQIWSDAIHADLKQLLGDKKADDQPRHPRAIRVNDDRLR